MNRKRAQIITIYYDYESNLTLNILTFMVKNILNYTNEK